jgi:hypothetical protein
MERVAFRRPGNEGTNAMRKQEDDDIVCGDPVSDNIGGT